MVYIIFWELFTVKDSKENNHITHIAKRHMTEQNPKDFLRSVVAFIHLLF